MGTAAKEGGERTGAARLRRAVIARLSPARRVYAIDLFWRAARNFIRLQGQIYAAAISYYVLFSFFPLLLLSVAVLGWFVRDPDVNATITDAVLAQIPPELGLQEPVEGLLDDLGAPGGGVFGLIGLVGLAWTASGVFGALRRVLNRVFAVPSNRSFVHARAIDLLAMICVPTLLILSTLLTLGLRLVRTFASDYFDGLLIRVAWGVVFLLVPLATSFAVFLLLYRLVPNLRPEFADLWAGALFAAVGFELAKAGFGFYVTEVGDFQTLYGPLGGAVTFLVFVYLVANVVIFGGGIVAERWRDRVGRDGVRREA